MKGELLAIENTRKIVLAIDRYVGSIWSYDSLRIRHHASAVIMERKCYPQKRTPLTSLFLERWRKKLWKIHNNYSTYTEKLICSSFVYVLLKYYFCTRKALLINVWQPCTLQRELSTVYCIVYIQLIEIRYLENFLYESSCNRNMYT